MLKNSLLCVAIISVLSTGAFAADKPDAKAADKTGVNAADKPDAKATDKTGVNAADKTSGKAADKTSGKAADKTAGDTPSKECTFEVLGTDKMKFAMNEKGKVVEIAEIKVPEKCRNKSIGFTLKNVSTLPKEAKMFHNFVVGEATKLATIAMEGIKAGESAGFVPATADGMLGHTKTLQGGETSDLLVLPKGSFKDGVNYGFVCTYPGHSAIMNGKFTFVKS